MTYGKYLVALTCSFALACGTSEDNNGNGVTINTSNNATNNESNNSTGETTTADMGGAEDIPTFGDVGSVQDLGDDGCDEAAELADAWPLNDAVSTGSVDSMDSAGTWTATIDASAGGTANAASNPFVYLDLDTGARVDITDIEAARTDTTWDIAFRRTAAFINGGDSGPGDLEITRLTGTSFDAVTSGDIPTSGFITEDGVDDNCEVISPPSGFGSVLSVFEQLNPDTTSGSWFNYGMGSAGSSITAYDDHVYIIRSASGATFKFGFVAWTSGNIDVQWAEL